MLRNIALGTLAVYWMAIFVGTHLPNELPSLEQIDDKILHFGAYAGLAFLLVAAFKARRLRHGTLLLPLAVAAIYGCVDELSQKAVPGRQADVADWAADVLGAGVGVFAFGVLSLCIAKVSARPAAPECEAVTKSAA